MYSRAINIVFITLVLIFSACVKYNPPRKEQKQDKSKYIKINRQLVRQSQNTIKAYIREHNLQMDSTATGIWYKFLHKTQGYVPTDGDKVTIAYRVMLLNGKECYSSDSLGLKTFSVNHSAIISGLNEAVQLMPEGSEAVFIIPPYRAYGLTGDGDCIPPNSVIIYQIELLAVQKSKSH